MNFFKKLFGIKTNNPSESTLSKYELLADENRKDFEWQSQINGKQVPEFFLYPFCKNGVTLLVTKYDGNTCGMGWYIIDDFTEEGKFKRANPEKFGYTYASDVNFSKKEADELYERIKSK